MMPTRRAGAGIFRGFRTVGALLLAGAAFSPACAPLPDDGTLGTAVEELNANSRAAFDYFRAQGLTAVQAAGIVGNLMQESGCNPMAVQPGGPGRGIAQWSAGGRWDHDAGDNATAFAASRGASVWSLTLQLDFIWFELTHFSGYGLAQLRAATTVTAATVAFQDRFEGCGTCVQTQRIAYANEALAAYGSDAASTWGASFVSQTFPYASAGSVSIVAGRTASVSITMRNSGTHAWDSRTCIGTTQPRDRRSAFAGSEWPAANRPACVPAGATVASGANHTFTWTMHAPATAGRYDERWGMLEESTAWFSDPGQGGPPDSDLEGIFVVTPAPPPADAGTPDAGHDAGSANDAAPPADRAAVDTGAATDDVSAGDAGLPVDESASDVRADAGVSRSADATADGSLPMEAPSPAGCGCRAAGTAPARGRANFAGILLATALFMRRARKFCTASKR